MGRVYQRRGRTGWYVDYVDAGGKRVRELATNIAGKRGEGIAQRKLFKLEEKRDLIKAGVAVPGAFSDVDVWKLWKDFRAHLEANGRRKNTQRYYKLGVESVLLLAQGDTGVSLPGRRCHPGCRSGAELPAQMMCPDRRLGRDGQGAVRKGLARVTGLRLSRRCTIPSADASEHGARRKGIKRSQVCAVP